jgi:hypothetical protein
MIQGLAFALALTIAGSGLALWWMDGKLEAAKEEAAQAREDRGKEEQSRKGFEAAATKCSASVAGIQAAAKALVEGYQKRLKTSQAQTAQAEGLVDQLLSARPAAGLDECQATFFELDQEIDRRHKPDEKEPPPAIDDRHPDR